MAKTIKEIADELGVSKQAVVYRLNQLETTHENMNLSTKENGVIYISLVAENMIKSAFNKNNRQNFDSKIIRQEPPRKESNMAVLNDTIRILNDQLCVKDKQLESKDLQIEALNVRMSELLAQNSILTDTINKQSDTIQAQQAITAGTIQMQLQQKENENVAEDNNNHWWNNLFRKGKNNE